MDDQQLLKEICQKEIEHGCYDVTIDGVSVYALVRRSYRDLVLRQSGLIVMNGRTKVNKIKAVNSVLLSAFHVTKLFFAGRKCSTLFYSFPRVDNINGEFLDKFTDPLIDVCNLGEDYIIFEHGLGGVHKKPRRHNQNVVYIDCLHPLSKILSKLFWGVYYKKHKKEFVKLENCLNQTFGPENSMLFFKDIFRMMMLSKILGLLLRQLSIKRVLGPARDYLTPVIVAAKKLNINIFELQHGITYGESSMYSGYRHEMLLPDYFLAFGDNKPQNVYGIDEHRIVNIGWALQDYISQKTQRERYQKNDVLVISEPEVTDAIFGAVKKLANDNPNSNFFIRAHPHEVISDSHMKMIEGLKNVKIQDKNINISVVLLGFENVIGESSTVLYEALAINKKVGKLFYNGLRPQYLEEQDRESFWEIRNQEDFRVFMEGSVNDKINKSIYSAFNKSKFLEITGIVR